MSTCTAVHAPPVAMKRDLQKDLFDWLLLVAPGVIWGGSFLFIAEGLESVGPNGVAFLRIAFGFLTLSFIPAVRRPIARADWKGIVLLGVIWMAFPLTMFPYAELRVSSALAGMLNGATPVFAAAVAGFLARRFPARGVVIGLVVGFGGAILMAVTGAQQASGDGVGIVMILFAIASYGFAFNLAGALQQRSSALQVIWRALGVGMLLTAPFGIPEVLAAQWKLSSLLSLIALGSLGTGIAYVLSTTAAGRMGATRASASTFITPVVALFLGIAVRHESVTIGSLIGAAICLAGAWIIRQARRV